MSWLLPTITPGVAPWVYFLCVGLSVVVVGISKAGFGGGVGILAIPLMASVMDADHMLGVMLPTLIAADILSNLHYLKDYDFPKVRPMIYGAAIGVIIAAAGLYLLRDIDRSDFDRWLKLGIGVICLFFVGVQAFRLTGREIPTLPPHPASGASVGFIAGFVSTFSHSAGPIATVYLLQEKLEKRRLVASLLLYFLVINTAKVPAYAYLGFINTSTLRDSIWFIPLLPVGTLLGAWMNHHIRPKPFTIIMYTAAGITAAWMIYKAL